MNTAIEKYLARVREKFPTFQDFGQGSEAFDKEEREYKVELVELYRATVAESLRNFPADEESRIAIGKNISALFTARLRNAGNKPQNLVGYRYFEPLKLEGGNSSQWAFIVKQLIDSEGQLTERIDQFVDSLDKLIKKKVLNSKVAFAALSRSVTTFLLMLSDPTKHAIVKTQEFNRALKAFDKSPMASEPLSGREYGRLQEYLREVNSGLLEAGITPRDMIDVQSFIWVGVGKPPASEQYWLLGASWDGEDKTPVFVAEGRWENGYEDKLLDRVRKVKLGDRVAIKSTYTRKFDLPFNSAGKTISCMDIKARGTVKKNLGDGHHLKVDWETDFEPRTIYFYTYRSTIDQIDKTQYKDTTIAWVFGELDQDVDWLEEQAKLQKQIGTDEEKLSLGVEQGALLRHFQGHQDFVERQPGWTKATTELFGRLARAVNQMGLDWWFTRATNSQLRFGRKEQGVAKGGPVGWLSLRKDGIWISWSTFAGLAECGTTELTSEIVRLFEVADKDEGIWPAKLGARSGRNGYWPDDYDIEDEPLNTKAPKNFIYYGPPGTGKTFELQRLLGAEYTDPEYGELYEFITFHQSYGYEEFVEGLRPVITKLGTQPRDNIEAPGESTGEVRYEIKPGAFLRLCERARKNPSRQYAMVIDEINRGNVSKIFGELITLVEVDKRERAKNPVSVVLPYSGENFSVPLNVDVIGTMNTADRSLALLDTALRRRFDFIEWMPKPSVLTGTIVSHNGVDINIERLLVMLNDRIEALYDRDHTLGHAYFTRIKDLESVDRFSELKAVFRNKIVPLLQEYFFEDWQKIRLVLGDNQKSNQGLQFVQEVGGEDDLQALFGSEHELSQYAVRSRFQLNSSAFEHPDAYVYIYAAKTAVIVG
jgi:5-methylcytosine-specific restriction protein B